MDQNDLYGKNHLATDEDDLELDDYHGADEGEESGSELKGGSQESVSISKSKIMLIKKMLLSIKDNNEKIMEMLSVFLDSEDEKRISIGQTVDENFTAGEKNGTESRVIEGVFDGEGMIGPDGKQYSVPSNYASKSKLVEGDILKLTITDSGTFVYKQIGPIERSRVIGILEHQANGNFYVVSEGQKWRVLTASVTYFKGASGDEAVILVPKAGESKWGALENIVKAKS